MPKASIIIPLFNGWNLTRNCLRAIAGTTKGLDIEIIVVDNASTDVTRQAAPFLGKELFGGAFHYIRNERNRNFGPASNQAALLARGEYLILLNNDTEPLPGWCSGLLDDFAAYPDIAGTGPLLLYPAAEPFGHTVQHLGVYINYARKVGHLYRAIPAQSPLARKRRFFQVITAACMAIPRRLFLAAGMFDECYVNGFEDVDLCARLFARGHRFTVNTDVAVVHHESQTAGRHEHTAANSEYYMKKAMSLLKPDLESHVLADGMELALSCWLAARPALPVPAARLLDATAGSLDFTELKNALAREPLWETGWRRLLVMPQASFCMDELRKLAFMLFPDPFIALKASAAAHKAGHKREARYWLNTAAPFAAGLQQYKTAAETIRDESETAGDRHLAKQAAQWLAKAPGFEKFKLRPFLHAFGRLKEQFMPVANKQASGHSRKLGERKPETS